MQQPQLISESAAKRYVEQGWWRNETILDAFEAAVSRTPEKTAVVAPGGVRLTYAQLDGLAKRAACGLAAAGVRKGDVVSIQLPNCAEFVVTHLAASRLGAVTNLLLPTYRTKELRYILGFAQTKVVVIPSRHRNFDFPAMYADLWPGLPDLAAIYVVGGGGAKGMRSYEALFAHGEASPREQLQGNDVTALIFTSGTEATPKGVLHTHNTMMYGTTQMAHICRLTCEDVVWVPSPAGHGTGFQWGMRQAIALGGTMVLQDIWDVDEALRLIEQEHCTFVMTATPFVVMLLESPALRQPRRTSLRVFTCAGAPIPRLIGEKAREKIGTTLIGMWGMSECFVGTASSLDASDDKLFATDGCAMPGGDVAIFDDTRTGTLAAGEVGELAVRGPFVAIGYFNDPERTASTFRSDGWLFTNDLATMDRDGYIRIVGRKKDIINRGALKISSREIEDMLIEHPAVARVALVPLPDQRLGEKACACLVTRDGAEVTIAELATYLSDCGVAKYKLPEYIAILDEFPMTPSGKIQKFRLRDDIIAGAIGTSPQYKAAPAVKDE